MKRKKKYEKKYGRDLIRKIKFQHLDLVYLFKFHKANLGEVGSRFPELIKFIGNMEENCPHDLFEPEGNEEDESNGKGQKRSSQLDLNVEPLNLDFYQTRKKVFKLAEFALKGNKERNKWHEEIQNLMLRCDNATFAVEVPIWYYDKKKEATITSHIGFLQGGEGKIFILDHKPKAEKIDPVSQLFSYARGLSFRTEAPLRKIKATWFNQKIYREFDPL